MAVKAAMNQPEEKNAQRDPGERGGRAITVQRRGISAKLLSGV